MGSHTWNIRGRLCGHGAFWCALWVVTKGITAFAQISLTPSAAPSPTLRTLDQVEPRIPISTPCAITQPGSYYLTGDIAFTVYGVVIRTNNVTLDLMGFTLSGDRGNNDYGIYVEGAAALPRSGVRIRNGRVTNTGTGVYLRYAGNCRVEDVVSTTNVNYGVKLYGNSGRCSGNTFRRCTVSGNGYGFVLEACSDGECNGNRLIDCVADNNQTFGLLLNGNGGECSYNEIRSMRVTNNGKGGTGVYGVSLDGSSSGRCDGNTLLNCTIAGNATDGGYLFAYQGSCSGNRIEGCLFSANSQNDLCLNQASGNIIVGNTFSGVSAAGLTIASSDGNLVMQNMSADVGSAYLLDASQVYGPVVSASGELSTSDSSAHPWANFAP